MSETLLVSEIFRSIQGESTRAGLPCTFIRLAGCDRSCRWCDTAYARSGGTAMTLDAIVGQVLALGADLVEVTGGEPLLQDGTPHLLRRLLETGATVLIETGGHRTIRDLDPRIVRIVDVKCPSSGETGTTLWENLRLLRRTDEVRFVLANREDYDWAREILDRYSLADRCPVSFSPVFGELDAAELSRWILEDKAPVRLGLQIHKYIWGADARGV